jgi:Excalibur calcium-binding domain
MELGSIYKYLIVAVAMVVASPAFAHGGGLDASGCHNDRKRGGYHCHGAKLSAALSLLAESKRESPFLEVKRKAKRGFAQAKSLLSDTNVYYANCGAARAAGAAPLREGLAGYTARLDRDRDGIACE